MIHYLLFFIISMYRMKPSYIVEKTTKKILTSIRLKKMFTFKTNEMFLERFNYLVTVTNTLLTRKVTIS